MKKLLGLFLLSCFAACSPTSDSERKIRNVQGCWFVDQKNAGGQEYRGVLNLAQSGSGFQGMLDWENHQIGAASGTVFGDSMSFQVTYPSLPNLVGMYSGILDGGGEKILQGKAKSNGNDSSTWIAAKTACPADK